MEPRYESPHRRQRHQSQLYESRHTGNAPLQLEQHEFIYPLGTKPTTVWTNDLNKAAAKWKLQLRDKNDLRTAYERLQTRLSSYNVWLIEYDQITKSNQCCAMTPDICENYKNARALMSKSLYMIMDDNQDTYFEHYTDPITFLSTYRREQDGFAFITHMMEAIHPNLKTISNRQAPAAPKFDDHENLYEFINSYIDWIEDEFICAKREYTDRERINYIRSELDSRYSTAKTKIESKLDELNTHESIEFPTNLKLTSKLAK
jgi:ATP-dependent Lon protease